MKCFPFVNLRVLCSDRSFGMQRQLEAREIREYEPMHTMQTTRAGSPWELFERSTSFPTPVHGSPKVEDAL